MMDQTTAVKLAALRRQIAATEDSLRAVDPNRPAAEATPFLSACADELETLAGLCRRAAGAAGGDAR